MKRMLLEPLRALYRILLIGGGIAAAVGAIVGLGVLLGLAPAEAAWELPADVIDTLGVLREAAEKYIEEG